MIYLASPYSHKDKAVQQRRFEATRELLVKLMRDFPFVYSPIVYCHPLSVRYELPGDAEYWKKFNMMALRRADQMLIHTLDGWKESKGIAMEIELAQSLFIPVDYVS